MKIVFLTHLIQQFIIVLKMEKMIHLFILEIFMQCGYVILVLKYGLTWIWQMKTRI